MRPWRRAVAAIALMGALAACGGDNGAADGQRPAAEPTAETPVVEMTDSLKFEPMEITVSVGDRVEWRNVGQIAHTVTTDPSKVADPKGVSVPDRAKPWDSGVLGADETFVRSFKKPGTYRFVCVPHEGARMVGTVVVES